MVVKAGAKLQTAASVISFISQMEEAAAAFYEQLAAKFTELSDLFSSCAKESRKSDKTIRRAYYNVVSDALETGFCFNLTVSSDLIAPEAPPYASLKGALLACIALEEETISFYALAAKQSRSLLSDVPAVMERVAKTRSEKKIGLKKALDETVKAKKGSV
jgi:rubrerythrin